MKTKPANLADSSSTASRRVDWESFTVIVLLLLLAAALHGPVFGGLVGYRAAFGGVCVGSVVALLGTRARLNWFETFLVLIFSYFLWGGFFALPSTTTFAVLPSMNTLQIMVVNSLNSWKDLLTLNPPAGQFIGPTVMPYLSGTVLSALSVSAALRLRKIQELALLPVVLLAVLGIAWGNQTAPYAIPVAAGGVILAVLWAARQAHRRRVAAGMGITAAAANGIRRRQKFIFGFRTTTGIALALALSIVLVPGLTQHSHREVLRDYVVPPLDLSEYHSPLSSYRYWMDNQKDSVLFSVSGLQDGQRVRLAALDAYDGTVMRVGTDEVSEGFQRVGATVNTDTSAGQSVSTLSIKIGDYNNHWVPGSGQVTGIDFTSADADAFYDSLYYSANLQSLFSVRGVTKNDTYQVKVATTEKWSDSQLADKSFGNVTLPELENVPPVFANRLSEFLGQAHTPIEKVRAIAEYFSVHGFYSDGTDGKSLPSHSSARMAAFLDPDAQMIGDDEQYAVAMTLMARSAGIPARVVVGFYPDKYSSGTTEITGSDAHAWVEVNFSGVGWVAFDPTPPHDQVPKTEISKPKPNPQPQVMQPPIQPEDPAELTPDVQNQDDKDSKEQSNWLLRLVIVAKVVGVVSIFLLPVLIVVFLKMLRRKRRKKRGSETGRSVGAWLELVDRATDLGAAVPRRGTRAEQARWLDTEEIGFAQNRAESFGVKPAQDSAGELAAQIDALDYGPEHRQSVNVEKFWHQADNILTVLAASTTRRRRFFASFNPRSLLLQRAERSRLRHEKKRQSQLAGQTNQYDWKDELNQKGKHSK